MNSDIKKLINEIENNKDDLNLLGRAIKSFNIIETEDLTSDDPENDVIINFEKYIISDKNQSKFIIIKQAVIKQNVSVDSDTNKHELIYNSSWKDVDGDFFIELQVYKVN